MAIYECEVCGYEYNEETEGVKWEDLPDDWFCPDCGVTKDNFFKQSDDDDKDEEEESGKRGADGLSAPKTTSRRTSNDLENYIADIHLMAKTGTSIIESMRTKKPVISWDDILIKGAQLAKIPLNENEPVSSKTIIGPNANQPLKIETPIYISHMSFGAISKEAKTALAKGSASVKTAMCSGEGGILEDSINNSYKYIFEYIPHQYSVTDENLKRVDAIEIKIGQSSKPGMGGHLPGSKVTSEIANIRGFKEGEDIISPSHYDDILTPDELTAKISWLRDKSDGKPIGVKIAAGNIEDDLEIIIQSKPDFITIDGRPGASGASPKQIKDATSLPTIFALHRAKKFLDNKGINDISLVITGGLRVSSDFAKALAMGADAIAIASAALIALGCQQYRVCHLGTCPLGICTQDEELRKRFDIEQSAKMLENYLNVCTKELKTFARITGNNNIHNLSVTDLCTTNSEISMFTNIPHA